MAVDAQLPRTRASLLQLRQSLGEAREGHALLERKREVLLRGLDSTTLILRSRTTVGRDFSVTLPSVVQQEIMDTAEQELPPEFRDLVRKYYESLSHE